MSVESSISSLISSLKSLSSSYRSNAKSLVQKADDDLRSLAIPDVEKVVFSVNRELTELDRIPRPPTLPGLDELELPEPDSLQYVDQLTDQLTDSAPGIVAFNPPTINLPDSLNFSKATPRITTLSSPPQSPVLTNIRSPSLHRPSLTEESPLSGDPYNVPIPVFTAFEGDVFSEYQDGLRLTGDDLKNWSEWLRALHVEFSTVEANFITRLQKSLTGDESGLSETWETGQYEQAQQAIHAERYDSLIKLDDSPSLTTGLPSGSRVYQNIVLELKTLEAKTQAAAKLAGTRHEQEVKHLQWALSTATRLLDVAIGIRGQEVVWRMTGALLALEGANATLDMIEQVWEFKKKELEFIDRYNETQVRRMDDRLKIELTNLESLKIEEGNNQLIAEYNENQSKVYQIAANFIETKIKLYQTQLAYFEIDIDRQRLELQAFEADIKAYQAKVKSHSALVDALKARIKGDLTQTEAELLKVEQYEGQLALWAANKQALTAKVQAQIAQNKSLLDQYNATLGAQLSYLRTTDRFTQSAVAAIIKRFDVETAEQQIKLADQQLSDQSAIFSAINKMKYQQAKLWKELQTHQVWLQQGISQSQVIDNGASVFGSIATQAFAGLNSVGATEIIEGV